MIQDQEAQAAKLQQQQAFNQELNENKMMMLAKAKRHWADLTDFELTVKCISKISPNELTEKRINIQIKK